jgi:hypothetical protein
LDNDGYFSLPEHRRIRVSKMGRRFRLAASVAQRDIRSNFLVSQEVGPVVVLPEAFSADLQRALRFGQDQSFSAHLADEQGYLANSCEPRAAKTQPLSDWQLAMSIKDGTLQLRFSAALSATSPIPTWRTGTANFWTTTAGPPPRLTIEINVDVATRVASYGGAVPGASDEPKGWSIDPIKSTLLTMKLGDAPIGVLGQLFVHTADSNWASLYVGENDVAITPQKVLFRHPNGFMTHKYDNDVWPRIWLTAIDMDTIVKLVRSTFECSIELNQGYFGHLQQHHSYFEYLEPQPRQSIDRMRLDAQLDLHGLSVSYSLHVNDLHPSSDGNHKAGWLEGIITLPWEILTLRYPQLTKERARLLPDCS